ncbi:flagellar hook-basal body protein [Sporosarcina sp. ANT_H38]|uniref:flagellar hook-basal body protein n=1 Tax=Sporosarcina sp. ANT_H38 TaxID=2597358 RepID=UPI0011F1E33D|nr:flagellar hook-basal body protein [Sporosarcina sp. ANT_H38]KAA0955635.1 flagellar hook-basal body protein [Sporosarcina sp. ANT_H38]
MIRTMTTATNTLSQLQSQIDIIGNNLANVSTHGFKASDAKFQEMLYQQFNNDKADTAPRQSPLGIRYGSGAVLGQSQMNWKAGSLQNTGRELDFALTTPKQYFNVLMPDGGGEKTVYTRQGNFYVSPVANGQLMLVNGEGYPVANSAGLPITFSDNVKNYTVKSGGNLQLTNADGTTQTIELAVTVMERPNLMQRLSATNIALPENLADLGVTQQEVLTELQGAARSEIGMEGQALEASNVNYQKEMTDLISVQRNYQFNARTVTLADQMLGLVNGIR